MGWDSAKTKSISNIVDGSRYRCFYSVSTFYSYKSVPYLMLSRIYIVITIFVITEFILLVKLNGAGSR